MPHRVKAVAPRRAREPDRLACAEGRPAPLGMHERFAGLAADPPSPKIKVGDTASGIFETVAGGCPTAGVTLSGRHVRLTSAKPVNPPAAETARLRATATEAPLGRSADLVIGGVADRPAPVERPETKG